MKTVMRKAMLPAAVLAGFGGGIAVSSAGADQPYMHQAADQLMAARATLQAGAPDKGGHRVRAMQFVDRAIAEVRMGIDYDRRHY